MRARFAIGSHRTSRKLSAMRAPRLRANSPRSLLIKCDRLAAKWNSCVAFPQPTILCWRSFHFYLRSFLIVDHDPAAASATPPGCRKSITRIVAEQRDELAPFHCPMPSVLPTERIAHLGSRLLRPSPWAERDDRDHAAENLFQGGSPKQGHPTYRASNLPHHQKSFYAKFPAMRPG